MYIRSITKKNKTKDKVYTYYRLCHSYKVGKKTRQQMLLNLGKLSGLPKDCHKALANRIEEILTGASQSIFGPDKDIEDFAQKFSRKIIEKGVFKSSALGSHKSISKDLEADYQEVNINSIEQTESKSIGGEWLAKQTFDRFALSTILEDIGMSEGLSVVAQKLLIAKMIHPSSELETQRWLKENSGADELFESNEDRGPTRYSLYKAALFLYENKGEVERRLYEKTHGLFSDKSKIVIYDLTNMHFEGQMLGSKKAAFGRSKQKRNDKRLIGLALAIDSLGFVRYSKIYKGNVSEPGTFEAMLDDVASQLYAKGEKPVVVMDAGIGTEENLGIVKNRKYDYICVSRSKPKEYAKLSENATKLSDSRGNTIEVTKAKVADKNDFYLHIKSHQKVLKEQSMSDKVTQRFEEEMNYLRQGLSIPRRLKKTVKVHERVGRIKNKYSKVSKLYKITYMENKEKGVVADIIWEKQAAKEQPRGEYFMRYSKEILTEKEIWGTYNMTRDIEATFCCLKTDLDIRPIYHQKDKYIEPHLWLGIIAYQMVNYIRQKLKEKEINYSWTTIVNKMEAQQFSIQEVEKKGDGKIFTKLITRPTKDMKSIYEAMKYRLRPFVRKTKVVTQL